MSPIATALHAARQAAEVVVEEAPLDECAGSFSESHFGLRIGAIFIILATSSFGTVLPIVLRQSNVVPRAAFDFAKYFGSGVIIATAFIHLLAPAFDALGSDCLSGTWKEYDFAPAFALIAVFGMFFAEVAAYRMGTKRLMKLGIAYSSHADDETDAHAHSHRHDPPLAVDTSGPEHPGHVHPEAIPEATANDIDAEEGSFATLGRAPSHPSHSRGHSHAHAHSHAKKVQEKDAKLASSSSSINQAPSHAEATAQLVAVGVLEFGVILHSIIIGLTLAVSEEFIILFIVIIFHQMFEGLGLGSRLAGLHLHPRVGWARYAAAILYAVCTPIGVAVGLGVRHSYNGNGVAANIVSGTLDAISAGILLYTGLVELLAHEILLNPRMMQSSNGKLAYVFVCMSLGAGLMALLGRWA